VVLVEGIQAVKELWVYNERREQCVGTEILKLKVLAMGNMEYEYEWKKPL
jgi:hypothetical protein